MKRKMISAFAAVAVFATTQVYRLELDTETQVPSIVGQDGVRREVCIVDPEQYALMTGQVAQVWRSLHKDEAGRSRLHGKRGATEIDTTNGVKVTVYEDGYRHVEHFEVKTVEKMRKFADVPKTTRDKAVQRVRDKRMSERQQKFRDALESRKNAPVRTVTIEHNAATGKDSVK